MKNPKILYLSAHSIHCFDDYRLFLELGCDVFAVHSSYTNPHSPVDPNRPAIKEGKFYPELFKYNLQCSKENLHEELIKWCDLIYVQHFGTKWIPPLWDMAQKHKKKVLWRGAGQSVRSTEEALKPYRDEGMLIVRYSPREKLIPGYIGEDAMIRFYKDPEEWKGWNGKVNEVTTVCQSIKKRREACNWDAFNEATKDFPRKVYGRGNDGLGDLWGGEVSYEKLRSIYKDYRVYFYVGTMPAPYTLNFLEAWLTGIPIVSIGPELGNPPFAPEQKTFEIQDLIENNVSGFVSDSIEELRSYISTLLEDYDLAKRIGAVGRQAAIETFGKSKIKREWKEFFDAL